MKIRWRKKWMSERDQQWSKPPYILFMAHTPRSSIVRETCSDEEFEEVINEWLSENQVFLAAVAAPTPLLNDH